MRYAVIEVHIAYERSKLEHVNIDNDIAIDLKMGDGEIQTIN